MTHFPRLSAAAITLLCTAAAPALAATYKSNQGHTEVRFSWSHAGVTIQTGEFTEADITLDLDPENPADASVSATIMVDSVATGVTALDDDLKSANFFEVQTYPEITFVSTGVEVTGETTANVMGDLTMHGNTLPVTLAATLTHLGEHPVGAFFDSFKGDWVAFAATTEIDHQAFGVGAFSTGPITIDIVTEMKAAE